MLHVELNGNEAENTLSANTLPFYTLRAPRLGQKVKTFSSEVGHVVYQIKGKDL